MNEASYQNSPVGVRRKKRESVKQRSVVSYIAFLLRNRYTKEQILKAV